MAKTTKLIVEFDIEVDGEPYVWRLHRLPQWSYDPSERHGKVLAVRHQAGQREAMIEFPPGPKPKFSAPPLKPSQIPVRIVAKAIASAIEAGWEPLSRGKPVVIYVDEEGA
ncbi:hypothetical protein [Caulobacter segnis]|uniref:Uncharacterized protein n=1 Tax=Caulobacter segnis TaxID=88688 RepID=A0A2W5X9Z2_9CAUL|nr:hypothetical protein [Caulobacter segnis]PZR33941.1 MAG: hypothetical protein DI526_11940 [Caulobacter segnis]